jgi:hypothetical protein
MPVMPQEMHDKRDANAHRWFLGNAEAIDCIANILSAFEFWDDLIDKDVELEDDYIHKIFVNLLFVLPQNRWFVAHTSYYMPLLMMCFSAYFDSNEMCKSEKKHIRNLAFHIRNLGLELYIATAFLVGGYTHMREVSREIREFFAVESFEEWEFYHA